MKEMILNEVNGGCELSSAAFDRTSAISFVDFRFRVSTVDGTSAVANEPYVNLGSPKRLQPDFGALFALRLLLMREKQLTTTTISIAPRNAANRMGGFVKITGPTQRPIRGTIAPK